MKAMVVTAYVPLDVKHLTSQQYYDYGNRLEAAVGKERLAWFETPLEACWCHKYLDKIGGAHLPPATPVPSDRYASPGHMVRSNIVQHNRTSWMDMAAQLHPDVEVLIWLDLAILKQGGFTGKPVTEEIVRAFVDKVEASTFTDIPFPGIWDRGPISDDGPNWRFCGSTHIIPRQHLLAVDRRYKYECQKFIRRTHTVPLDLPVWAAVEAADDLPFRWYSANHDATQLTNFPEYPHV